MDWTKCIICGEGGDLKCPTKSLQGNSSIVYQTFVELVNEFSAIVELPTSVALSSHTLETAALLENKAKWQKSCHLK